MLIHVVRDTHVQPGAETWLDLPGEIILVVSAAGITADGAAALEGALMYFLARGVWEYATGRGAPMDLRYFRTNHLPPTRPAMVTSRGHLVKVYLCPDHFSLESFQGLYRASLECVAHGWRITPMVASEVR